MSSPNLGFISGVGALSAADAWIVGVHAYPGNLGGTLVEHWNGSTWGVVPSPDEVVPTDGSFDTLKAARHLGSGGLVVAVGSYQGQSAEGTLVLETKTG